MAGVKPDGNVCQAELDGVEVAEGRKSRSGWNHTGLAERSGARRVYPLLLNCNCQISKHINKSAISDVHCVCDIWNFNLLMRVLSRYFMRVTSTMSFAFAVAIKKASAISALANSALAAGKY